MGKASQEAGARERMRREILHKSDVVPPLPETVVRMLQLLGSSDTEPQDIEKCVQHDQVLVGKMLALVNSAFYGLRRSIHTIREAVMVLGFRGVRSLVLATSTAKFLQRDFTCYGYGPRGLWLHGAAVASGARLLARRAGLGDDAAEELFVAGLLHDVGKLLLVPYLNQGLRYGLPTGESVTQLELRICGVEHAEAGALACTKWNLGSEIEEIVGSHHQEGGRDATAAQAIVRVANGIAEAQGFGYLPGKTPSSFVDAYDLRTLAIGEAAWPALEKELVAAMRDASAALGAM